MTHPDETRLALLAGGEAGFWERQALARHLRCCESCRSIAESYRRLRTDLRNELDRMPPGINWDRLAAEMKANIHVGLAAGECVGEPRFRAAWASWWKPAAAVAGLLFILVSSFLMKTPREQQASLGRGIARLWSAGIPHRLEQAVYLEADRNGIQVKENGAALTIMPPALQAGAAPPIVSVSTQGSLRARYIDDDTGQITITNVYAQ
jgi:hypothetical protein